MRRYTRQILVLFVMLFFLGTNSAYSDEKLIVSGVVINDHSQYATEFANIKKIEYLFDTDIVGAKNGVVGSIYCDGKLIFQKELKFIFSKYNGDEGTGVRCYLDPPIELLPTDKVYKIVLPAGTIYKKSDPSVVNEEIVTDCCIPSKLTDYECSITDSSPVATEAALMIYYSVELLSPLKPHSLILYREGIPIMDFSTSGGWDFGFGFATSMFGGFLNFEKGVNYTFVLPEGSVYAKVRSDIVNAESVCSFVGAYDRPFA